MAESGYASSYGKRPLWFWIAIYVVIGLVVYGLVYYFFFAKKGYNYSGTNPQQNSTPSGNNSTPSSTPPSKGFSY